MVTLEQIKLLESKLTRAINFVSRLTEENSRLKKRNDELEETIAALKEEKARIEEGIVSALGKLNQFEDAIERSLGATASAMPANQKTVQKTPLEGAAVKSTAAPSVKAAPLPAKSPVQETPPAPQVPSAYTVEEEPDGGMESIGEEEDSPGLDLIEDTGEAELDIF